MPLRDNDPPMRRTGGPPAEGRTADDLRAQPFTDDVFSEYHARRRDAGNKPVGLIAGVAIGLVAVGGIGWYMYANGMLSGSTPGGVPQLVQADPEPYKVKPENPGGMQVENQDKLVYDRVAKGEAPPRVENLLPPPEEPKAPPQPAPPPPEVAAQEPTPAQEPTATESEAPQVPSAAEPEVDPLAAAVAAATGGREAATGPLATAPATPPETEEDQIAAAIAAAPAASPIAPVPGAFQVQLASARSADGAMGEWKRISGKNAVVLDGLSPSVSEVDLGEKGVFFRLRAGPLADKAAADAICAELAAQNVGCIVVRP